MVERRGDDIDLVLLDFSMPVMDGEQAFRAIRAIRPAVPVVFTSGYTEPDVMAGVVGEGLAGFLQKPWTVQALHEIVAETLGSVVLRS